MEVSEVKKYCSSLVGVNTKVQGEPNNVLVYYVGAKKFAYFKTSAPEKWRFSLRVTPERFLELTDQHGIQPARYMHRFHWVTIVQVQSVHDDYLKELIQWSYNKALSALSKKEREALTGISNIVA